MEIEEFWLVWFESTQQWIAILPTREVLANNWGSVGYAFGRVLDQLGRGEAEFECDIGTSDCQHWVKDEEFWIERRA